MTRERQLKASVSVRCEYSVDLIERGIQTQVTVSAVLERRKVNDTDKKLKPLLLTGVCTL